MADLDTLRKIERLAKLLPAGWLLIPEYPKGEVIGPCVCGSWPGGKCFRCPLADRGPHP